MSWSKIWQDQGMNADEVHFPVVGIDCTEEQLDAKVDEILDDLEQHCEVVYERGEDGLEHPVIRRK